MLENDVLVGYRDIELKAIDLDSWFEDREIQEFIEKIEKKSNKLVTKTRLQVQQKISNESSIQSNKNSDLSSDYLDERRLPLPGGIKEQEEKINSEENIFKEENIKNKSLEIYKYFIEKYAEIKFVFGEFLENKGLLNLSPYLIYFYSFLILFAFGLGVGFLRTNLKKSIQKENFVDETLVAPEKNKMIVFDKDSKEKTVNSSRNSKKNITNQNEKILLDVNAITTSSPSIEELKYLINTWLSNKSAYLAGKSEINLSKIAKEGLIKRTIQIRESDIKKGIYKDISSRVESIEVVSQTASRIVLLVKLNYLERILKNSGDLITETKLDSLKVKYILGFSSNSWKLVDFVSGL